MINESPTSGILVLQRFLSKINNTMNFDSRKQYTNSCINYQYNKANFYSRNGYFASIFGEYFLAVEKGYIVSIFGKHFLVVEKWLFC